MIVEITAKHVALAQRHHNLRNPIALALQDHDVHAVVTLDKVHRTCAHGALCKDYACQPSPLPLFAREYLEGFNRTGYARPRTLVL